MAFRSILSEFVALLLETLRKLWVLFVQHLLCSDLNNDLSVLGNGKNDEKRHRESEHRWKLIVATINNELPLTKKKCLLICLSLNSESCTLQHVAKKSDLLAVNGQF